MLCAVRLVRIHPEQLAQAEHTSHVRLCTKLLAAVLCNQLWLHNTEANTEGNKGSSLPSEIKLESLQIKCSGVRKWMMGRKQ